MPKRHPLAATALLAAFLATLSAAHAKEFYIGGPVHEHDMEIVANYLVGISMAPMPEGMPMGGPDVVHLEADVHATADNIYGYPDGAWVSDLAIAYRIEKQGSAWSDQGTLRAMIAKDGPHYASNVRLDGPGSYQVTYTFSPPDAHGVLRHTDDETGVPEWWTPFSETFTFSYPQS